MSEIDYNTYRTSWGDASSSTAVSTTYTDNTTWVGDGYAKQCEDFRQRYEKALDEEETKSKKIEGVDIVILYDVYLVYAEDRKKPIVINKFGVIARDEEDAKIKSGLMKRVEDEWDADYLNFICKEIGDVKVKEKPKEVKQVK